MVEWSGVDWPYKEKLNSSKWANGPDGIQGVKGTQTECFHKTDIIRVFLKYGYLHIKWIKVGTPGVSNVCLRSFTRTHQDNAEPPTHQWWWLWWRLFSEKSLNTISLNNPIECRFFWGLAGISQFTNVFAQQPPFAVCLCEMINIIINNHYALHFPFLCHSALHPFSLLTWVRRYLSPKYSLSMPHGSCPATRISGNCLVLLLFVNDWWIWIILFLIVLIMCTSVNLWNWIIKLIMKMFRCYPSVFVHSFEG